MTDIRCRTIADSVGDRSPRLWTVETRSPAMVHQEVLRHRRIITEEGLSVLGLGWEPDFSYSVSSTRAVPFEKMLAECRDPALRAAPIHWGSARKGMVPGDELDDVDPCVWWPEVVSGLGLDVVVDGDWITKRECAKRIWALHAEFSANAAETLVRHTDPHKSIANRLMSQHLHYNVLMTGTGPGWLNFFGLRLDGAADPIVRVLAEALWREWNEHLPRSFRPGEWHLPYADDGRSSEEVEEWRRRVHADPAMGSDDVLRTLQCMSVARCAHLSYSSFETGERMTVEQCVNLYRRLVGSVPIHASPTEHQATPDRLVSNGPAPYFWEHNERAGNLGPGWCQLRKMLPDEAVAPLPGAYR